VFGGNSLDKIIETYVKHIVSELNCSEKEKSDTAEEMKDHLLLLKNEYIGQGFSDEKATQKALQTFGDEKNLKDGFQNSLFPYYKFIRIGTMALFVLYSFILLWNLLLMRIIVRIINLNSYNRYFWFPQGSSNFFDMEVWKLNSNIIPFQNTYKYITGSDKFNLDIIIHNTLGNILIFVPLGIFLPILFNKYKTFSKVFISSILISITIEVLQFFIQIGQFDIDDIILNAIGSIMGYFIINILIKIYNFIRWNVLRQTTT
jgi:glycopeptide antibiotics resistance protein